MSTLPTRGPRWIKRYFEIKGTTERGVLFLPSPNLSNYILLALSRIHEPFVSRISASRPSSCLLLSLSPPLRAKYPDKMPLVEISGEPVSWKFSGTSRPDVRVSSSIGPSHRQHRCSRHAPRKSRSFHLYVYIYIYSAPGSNPLAFTFVHSSSLPFHDLSITTTPRKKRSTPELLNSGDKIHRITGRFTFIFIELTLPFVKLSSIVFFL